MAGQRTIASDHHELILVSEVVPLDVGEGRDDLALRRELSALLELEVANGTRESKVSVDTAKVDETASGSDTVLLDYIPNISELVVYRWGGETM